MAFPSNGSIRNGMMMRGIHHAGANELIYYALYTLLETPLVSQLVMKFKALLKPR
jgi:hypothetical protein